MEVEDGGYHYHYLLLLQMRIPGSTTLHVRTTVRVETCAHDDEMEDGSDSDGSYSYSDVLVRVHAATSVMSAEAENSQVNHHLPLHLLQHTISTRSREGVAPS